MSWQDEIEKLTNDIQSRIREDDFVDEVFIEVDLIIYNEEEDRL